MASYQHATYAHNNGPRQGVYPLQQEEHYKAVTWRARQFIGPQEMYKYRGRIEPAQVMSGPPTQPVRSLAWSNGSSRMPRNCSSAKPWRERANMKVGSQFCLIATSINVQTKPLQKQRPQVSVPTERKSLLTQQSPFSFLDPTQVKGDLAFDERLAQLVQYERDTVDQEELKQTRKTFSRPCSALSLITSTNSNGQRKLSSSSTPSQMRCQSALSHRSSRPSSTISHRSSSSTPSQMRCQSALSHRSSRPSSTISHRSNARKHIIPRSMSAIELKKTKASKYASSTNSERYTSQDGGSRSSSNLLDLKECTPNTSLVVDGNGSSGSMSAVAETMQTKQNGGESIHSDNKVHQEEPAITCTDNNLCATSDLGLSIDSLHFSGGENVMGLDQQLCESNIIKEQSSVCESNIIKEQSCIEGKQLSGLDTNEGGGANKSSTSIKSSCVRKATKKMSQSSRLRFPTANKPPTSKQAKGIQRDKALPCVHTCM